MHGNTQLSFLIAQHVSGDTPPIIKNSKTVILAIVAAGNQKRM
jgi:hypothetical protein